MRPAARWARRGAIVLALAVLVVLGVRAWVVPAVLAGKVGAQFHGRASFGSWWLGHSAGVEGLSLREGDGPDAPEWLSAKRVTTDLSLGGLLSGHLAPTRITIDGPKILIRLDRKGNLLTKGPFGAKSGATAAIPDVEIRDGEVTIDQEGRPPLVVRGVSGLVDREADSEKVDFASDDPRLGRWVVSGLFDPGFAAGTIRLASGPGFVTTPDLNESVPFVPPEVWKSVTPSGRVDVAVSLDLGKTKGKALQVRTEISLRDTKAILRSLQVESDGTTGRIEIEDGVVRVEKLTGRTLSGRLDAGGTLDFSGPAPRFDVQLGLDRVDVAAAPESWQLGQVGATGRLTGKVHLVATLTPDGPDLGGTSGEALIEGATLQGIPIKSLRLALQAEGAELQFDAKPGPKTSAIAPPPPSLILASMIGLQAPAAPQEPARHGLRLPKSITTRIELEDVDLKLLLSRLESHTKIKVPVPMAGHLALKAEATIPLGHLADIRDYTIRGDATLAGASIDGVDLGRLSGRFELDKGVLGVDDLRGQLVERPFGDDSGPRKPAPARPTTPPVVPGSFLGKLRAELSPPGRLTAHFEAVEVPVGELVAPYVPRPNPVGGRLDAAVDASAEMAHLGDPRAWSAVGRVASRHLSYQGSTLDAVATRFSIERGRIDLPDLAADLGGHPLRARFALDMADRRAYSGAVDVSDWALGEILALVPKAPRPAPASGRLDGRIAFDGTLSPPSFRSEGKALIRAATAGSVPLGDVSASWATEGDEVRVKEISARPFSGRFDGEASIPIAGGRPILLKARVASIDTDRLAHAVFGDEVRLSGIADGRLDATIPPAWRDLTVDLTLEAPAMVVQGVRAGVVKATIRGKDERIAYGLTAVGPSGTVSFRGDVPLAGRPEDRSANAALKADGFSLANLLELAGHKGLGAHLRGRASLDANLRARTLGPIELAVHGYVAVRDLAWGPSYPIGSIRGVLAKGPESWRLDGLRGDVLGGQVGGVVWGLTPPAGPKPISFDIQADRVDLRRVVALHPSLGKHLEGFGTLRLTGRMESSLRAAAEVSIPRARFSGIELTEFRLPAEITFHPGEGGGVVRSRRWTARVGGGGVQGSAWQRIGLDKTFSAEVNLTDMEIESVTRIGGHSTRPASGKVSGRITIGGPDPSHPAKFRGRVDLDLDDGAIGDIPVVRELSRFLGAAQGAAFEDGDLHATILNRRVVVEELTLQGRVVQVHATGSVGFDGGLDLAILVNTNQIISETGQALVGAIPGLRQAVGRSDEAMLRLANYFSNRLLKFRVGGTLKNPNVAFDPGVAVTEAAAGFFSGVLKLPLGIVR